MNFNIAFWLLPVFAVPLLLLGTHAWPQLGRISRSLWMALVVSIIALFGVRLAQVVAFNINTLPEWDFSFFWLNGQVAARGLNFYDPVQYQQLARVLLPQPLTPAFQQAVLDVGFWYPPPSMFLFLPLGWVGLRTAAVAWFVVHGLVLIGNVGLVWQLFLHQRRRWGLALALALLLMLHATELTFNYAQTNSLLLLFVLLFWKDRKQPRVGVWLACAIVVKPIAIVLGLVLVLHRHWRALVMAAGTFALICLMAAAAFGPNVFMQFVFSGPTTRQPNWVYGEAVNQSLSAVILRTAGPIPATGLPLMQPVFIGLAAAMTALSAWLIWRLPRNQGEWAIAIALSLGLLIYPATLNHYSMLLVPPLLLMWQSRQALVAVIRSITGQRVGLLLIAAFIGAVYFWVVYRYGLTTFVANLLVWLGVCASVLVLTRAHWSVKDHVT